MAYAEARIPPLDYPYFKIEANRYQDNFFGLKKYALWLSPDFTRAHDAPGMLFAYTIFEYLTTLDQQLF